MSNPTSAQLTSLASLREDGDAPVTRIDADGIMRATFPHLTLPNVASEYQITAGGSIFYVGRVVSWPRIRTRG